MVQFGLNQLHWNLAGFFFPLAKVVASTQYPFVSPQLRFHLNWDDTKKWTTDWSERSRTSWSPSANCKHNFLLDSTQILTNSGLQNHTRVNRRHSWRAIQLQQKTKSKRVCGTKHQLYIKMAVFLPLYKNLNVLDMGAAILRWCHLELEPTQQWLGLVSMSHQYIRPTQSLAGLSCQSGCKFPFLYNQKPN